MKNDYGTCANCGEGLERDEDMVPLFDDYGLCLRCSYDSSVRHEETLPCSVCGSREPTSQIWRELDGESSTFCETHLSAALKERIQDHGYTHIHFVRCSEGDVEE